MLNKSALNFVVSQEDTMVEETVVSPVDSPSAAQPIVAEDVVVSTEPVAPAAVPADVVVEPVPETAVPVDIQMVVDTQNPTDMLGQATQEATFCQERADELLAMQHACEHYGKLLRQTGLEGVSEEGAAFMQVGLNMIQKSLGTDLVVSKESLDDIHPRSSRTKVTISVESVKELAGKAYDAFIAAIKRLIELAKKGWDHLVDFANDQDRTIEELLEKVKGLKGNRAHGKLKVNSPSLLYADGELVFPDFSAMTGLTHFTTAAYPKAMEQYFTEIGKYIRQLDPETTGDDEIEAHLNAIAKPLEALNNNASVEALFNGNYKVSVSENSLSFGIGVVDGAAPPESAELEFLAPVQMRKLLIEMRIANGLLKDYRVTNQRVINAAEKVIKEATSKKGDTKLDESVLRLVKEAAPRNREIAQFITKVTRAYVAVIGSMIADHNNRFEMAE